MANFFTRPNFEDRQQVQYSGSSITLSGDTNINHSGNLRIHKDAAPGLVATSLDSDGTIVWGPISGISWSVSACTSPFYVNHIISCPSSGGTILLEAGDLSLNSELKFLIPLSAGTMDDYTLVIGSDGFVRQIPTSAITPTVLFTGNTSANCITDLWVTNIHGCSPVNVLDTAKFNYGGGQVIINSGSTVLQTDYGNVIFNKNDGTYNRLFEFDHGVKNTIHFEVHDIGGNETNSMYLTPGGGFGSSFVYPSNDGNSVYEHDLSSVRYNINNYTQTKGINFTLQYNQITPTLSNGYLYYTNDVPIPLSIENRGYTLSGPTQQYDLVISGDSIVFGSIDGIPTARFDIAYSGGSTNLRIREGAQNGYVLTSDNDGYATWQSPTGGGGGSFTGNTSASCITDLWVSNIHGCSPITVHDTLIMGAGTSIKTSNGGVQIDLDAYGIPNTFLISDDNAAFTSRGFYFDSQGIQIYDFNPSVLMDIFSEGDLSIGTKSNNREIFMSTDQGPTKYTGVNPKKGVSISSQNSYFNTGITNSVILGGVGLTATTDNTVYVPDLVIKKSQIVPTGSTHTIGEDGSVTWDNNFFYWKANGQWLRISGQTF